MIMSIRVPIDFLIYKEANYIVLRNNKVGFVRHPKLRYETQII